MRPTTPCCPEGALKVRLSYAERWMQAVPFCSQSMQTGFKWSFIGMPLLKESPNCQDLCHGICAMVMTWLRRVAICRLMGMRNATPIPLLHANSTPTRGHTHKPMPHISATFRHTEGSFGPSSSHSASRVVGNLCTIARRANFVL